MRKNSNRIKKITVSILLILSVTGVSGCGTKTATPADSEPGESIVLEEPAGVAQEYDYVIERNLYQYEIYNSCVSPTVVEYSFSKDQNFKKYGATPGESVNPGDELVYSDTDDTDKEIIKKEEEIADFEEDHVIEMDALNKDIYDAKKREFEASEGVWDMLEWEPDEEKNKDFYDMWASLYMLPDSVYKRAIQNRMILEENQRQSEELFNLDREYMRSSLERLQNRVTDATIISDVTGEVVACNYYYDGDWIEKNTPVVAVGDITARVLKTDYISKGNINKALDIYALIDGKRYEIEYVNMEPEEYTRLTEQGEAVYTTFNIVDPDNEVELGQYAAIVMIKDRRTAVPCVPLDSLKKETDSYYVHVFDGTETKYVPVEIGMKDGKYAEVLSGVNLGDKVLSSSAPVKNKTTAVLERGDYSVQTEYGGFLYYPFTEYLTNPSGQGDTYVKEILVTDNEKVTEGQVLATLEVIPDQIQIDRINRQISRLESRLTKLNATKYDYDARDITDRSVERSIAENLKQTNRLKRELNKLTKYSGIVEVKAPYDGIILDAQIVKAGDLLYENSSVVEIADDTMSYVILRDEKNQLNYGNKATVRVSDNGKALELEGKVANVSNMNLSKKMQNEFSLISLPAEEATQIAGSALGTGGRWDRSSFKVNVTTRSMSNVILIPKRAVINADKSSYVKVIKDDGTVEMVSFIPGGSDNNYYWVAEGLTEGMTICLE